MNSTARQERRTRSSSHRIAAGATGAVLALLPAGATASGADVSAHSAGRAGVSAVGGATPAVSAAVPAPAEPEQERRDEDRGEQDVAAERISVAAVAAGGGAAMLVISGTVTWVQRRRGGS